jgi:hypothetical protein
MATRILDTGSQGSGSMATHSFGLPLGLHNESDSNFGSGISLNFGPRLGTGIHFEPLEGIGLGRTGGLDTSLGH